MGKYIWPRDVGNMTRWYLGLFKEFIDGKTLDEIIDLIGEDRIPYKKPTKDQLRRRLYRLHQDGWLDKSGQGRGSRYAISRAGIDKLERLSFRHAEPPRNWDERWRIVIFDIPEELRVARDHIRRLLQELGFLQLQKSVWIHPFAVLDEFKRIQSAYGLAEHIQLIETAGFKPPKRIARVFQKQYPKLIK